MSKSIKFKRRKSRKSKKRGGSPAAITETITFTVTGMNPGTVRQFRPDLTYSRPDFLRNLFIQSVNDYKEDEPEDETVLEEHIQIHHIRGAEDNVIFEGIIEDWTNAQIQTFLLSLQVGDRVHVEIIQS